MKIEYLLQLKKEPSVKNIGLADRIQSSMECCFHQVNRNSFVTTESGDHTCIQYEFVEHIPDAKGVSEVLIFLTFTCEEKNGNHAAKILDEADSLFQKNLNTGESKFLIIKLYDERSIHYCIKAYPLFCRFESKIRCLILKILTKTFGSLWAKETIPQEMQKDFRDKVKDGSYERMACEFVYEMDYGKLIGFLYNPFRSIATDEKIDKLLAEKDIGKINMSELRSVLEGIRLSSNWERFFKDVKIDKLDEKLKEISEQRNKVAHSKHYSHDDYRKDHSTISKFNKQLDEAIEEIEVRAIAPNEVVATVGSLFTLDIPGVTAFASSFLDALRIFIPAISKASENMGRVLTQVATYSAFARGPGTGAEKFLQLLVQRMDDKEETLEQTEIIQGEDVEAKQEIIRDSESSEAEELSEYKEPENVD